MTLLIILSTVALYVTPPGDPFIANPLNCITTVLQRVILLIVTVVMDKKYVNIDYTVYIIHCGYIQCMYTEYTEYTVWQRRLASQPHASVCRIYSYRKYHQRIR